MPIRRISLSSNAAQELIPITDRVQAAVTECGLQDGLCAVFCGHTTDGITLNSPLDPATAADLRDELNRIVPTRTDFHHVFDTPTDASAHVKSALVGHSTTLPVIQGQLALGSSQGIFFWEFDGPRSRQVTVQLLAEA